MKSYEEQQAEEEAVRREEEAACERLRQQLMQVRGTNAHVVLVMRRVVHAQLECTAHPGCWRPLAPAMVPQEGETSYGALCVEILCKPYTFHGPEHCQSKRS